MGVPLWRPVSADDRESISQALRWPVLCEPGLAVCSSPLFISLMSLAGSMLLIKHATQLLIVNQIQFVPEACCEWASPLRTKVFEQPRHSRTKDPRHHCDLPNLVGTRWRWRYSARASKSGNILPPWSTVVQNGWQVCQPKIGQIPFPNPFFSIRFFDKLWNQTNN